MSINNTEQDSMTISDFIKSECNDNFTHHPHLPEALNNSPSSEFNITPEIHKTIKALSKPIGSITGAIAESIDNSFDALATRVDIIVGTEVKNKKVFIITIDNGKGGDLSVLNSMFRIGSSGPEKGFDTLGNRGVGIMAAAHFLSDKFWAVMRKENGQFVAACVDFNCHDPYGWNDPKFCSFYTDKNEILKILPPVLKNQIDDDFVGCAQMFQAVHSSHKRAKVISTNLLKRKTKTSRNVLSFIYREILCNDRKVFVNSQKLLPSGHGHDTDVRGKPVSFTYFCDEEAAGKKSYIIKGPDGKSYDFQARFTLAYVRKNNGADWTHYVSTPNQGQIHLLRLERQASNCKIPLVGSGYTNNFNIGELHVDLFFSAEFIDKFFPSASDKNLIGINKVGHDGYNFPEKLFKLIGPDINECVDYNKIHFTRGDDNNPSSAGGHKKSYFPERIYRDRFFTHRVQTKYKHLSADEQAKKIKREVYNGGLGTRCDIVDDGIIVEVKIQADCTALGQCLTYMAIRSQKKCELISILHPSNLNAFLEEKQKIEKFYDVEIKMIIAEDDYFLKLVIDKTLTEEEKVIVKRLKKKK